MASDIENRDWLNDYPSLKQVILTNPFTVPDGYFEELGERVMSAIGLEELKDTMPLSGYTVPENYFEELSSNIQSRINIEHTLDRETGFTVPENYFEELSGNIKSRINIESALAQNEPGFVVPENYFEELNSQITSRILMEKALSGSAGAFTVPEDYFARLNKNILNKTVNQAIIKRKGIVRKLVSSASFKYATAACLALMVGTAIFIKQINEPGAVHQRSFLHKQLSDIPVNDIQSYLQLSVDGSDTQHTAVDEGLPINDTQLKDALQDYANTQ